MDEREAQDILADVAVDVRAPADVRARVWTLVEATLAGDEAAPETQSSLTLDSRHGPLPGLPDDWSSGDMVVVLEGPDQSSRRAARGRIAVALAVAASIVVMLVAINGDSDDRAVVADDPPGVVLLDPDASCGRFLNADFDHQIYADAETSAAIDPAVMAKAEEAFAQLRIDFEASENRERVAELLGSGSFQTLSRVEAFFRQARLQAEQGNQGAARRTLQDIQRTATPLFESTGSSNAVPCLGK